jgi:hypothetical protein
MWIQPARPGRGTFVVVLAVTTLLGGCNPFAGLENMEGCGNIDNSLHSEDAAKLEPAVAGITSMHIGSMSWTETGDRSTVVVTSALSEDIRRQ